MPQSREVARFSVARQRRDLVVSVRIVMSVRTLGLALVAVIASLTHLLAS